MARIRTIKPDFFRHEGLFEAEQTEGMPLRVAFAGLWTACDREGRFVWAPRQLKLDCLPYDDVDFAQVLEMLRTRGFVVKYSVQGKEYGCIPSWDQHQVINNREAASRIPELIESHPLTRAARVPDASPTRHDSAQGERKGKEGKGKEVEGAEAAPSASSSAPSNERKRATRIPGDWKPNERNVADAKALGLYDTDIERQARRFRDFWLGKSGQNATKADWDATWRNWVDKEAEHLGRTPPKTPGSAGAAAPIGPPKHGEERDIPGLGKRTFVKADTAEWQAWREHAAKIAKPMPSPDRSTGGWWFQSLWPPGHTNSTATVLNMAA